MSFSYQPPQPQSGYPPQHPHQYGAPPMQYGSAPQYGAGPSPPAGYAPPHHPHVAVNVQQQYGQAVQQGNEFNQPLFSPSQLAMSSSSPHTAAHTRRSYASRQSVRAAA